MKKANPDQPSKTTLEYGLTTDHCLVYRACYDRVKLRLLNNVSLDLTTDHKYTVGVTMSVKTQKSSTTDGSPRSSFTLPRYRIGLLAHKKTEKALCTTFDREVGRRPYLDTSNDVDLVDTALIRVLQLVCDKTLGRRPAAKISSKNGSSRVSPSIQDTAVSVLLYKSAATDSRENGVILPTDAARLRGVGAMEEVTASLRDRYAATERFADPYSTPTDVFASISPVPLLSEDDVMR